MADIARDADVIDEDVGAPAAAAVAATKPDDVIDEDATGGPAAPDAADGLPRHAEHQADGSVRLPLLFPVALRFRRGGEEREERFDALVLHRLTGRDRRLVGEAKPSRMAETAIRLASRMPEARAAQIYDRLDAADIEAAERVVLHFLGSGLKTGR